MLEKETFDLVLTDVVMPGIDGMGLLKEVKRRWPGTKVVILTGHARDHEIGDFLLFGADEYLSKPFQVHQLLSAVSEVLHREREG